MPSLEDIKKIRDLTGVGLTDAKQALQKHGDFDRALEAMRAQGLSKVAKRGGRDVQAGLVYSYIHDGRIGVLIEVNCETDFVAKTDDFQALVKDLTLQIAASSPVAISEENLAFDKQLQEEMQSRAAADKVPTDKMAEVVEARVQKYRAEQCLLTQSFNKEPEKTVGDLLRAAQAKLGEKIEVARFVRFELGGENPPVIYK